MYKNQFLSKNKLSYTVACGLSLIPGYQWANSKKERVERLNVVFILADDLRWNSLGCMGNDYVITPNIDALANEGQRFENAYVTTSISCVSRASILTGQYMSRHGITGFDKNVTEEQFATTYPALLRAQGYYTGFVGKYGFGLGRDTDFDFVAFEERLIHWLPVNPKTKIEKLGGGYTRILGDSIHITELNTLEALRFLETRPKDKAFNLSVSFYAPHAEDHHPDQFRYQPSSEKYYQNVQFPLPQKAGIENLKALPPFISAEQNEGRVRWHWRFDRPEKYQTMMRNYYRMVTEVDEAVGRIVAELKQQGVFENTMIVFMGDNGYFHGEHQLADKWYPYEESIRVPLVIYDPRSAPTDRGKRVQAMALNVDIAATLISAAGIAAPSNMQGHDLTTLYLGKKPRKWRKDFFYEHPIVSNARRIPSSQALVSATDKYSFWPDYDYEEYFDLKKDPQETKNEISNPKYKKKIAKLKKRFEYLKEKAK